MLALDHQRVHVERAYHVVVRHFAAQLRLPHEPLEEPRRGQQVRVDDLQRDLGARLETGCVAGDLGGVDRSHPARAQLGEKTVRTQRLALHGAR